MRWLDRDSYVLGYAGARRAMTIELHEMQAAHEAEMAELRKEDRGRESGPLPVQDDA